MPYRAPCADNPRAFVPGFTEHAMCDQLRLRQQRARSKAVQMSCHGS